MDFQQAEQQFQQIDKLYKDGKLNVEQYRTSLIQLRVTDDSGNIWQPQEITGKWHVFENGQWVAGIPPKPATPQPVISFFLEAEQKFQLLEGQYRSGRITIDQYRKALEQLRVTETNGEVWQLQEFTRNWFVFRNGQWVQAVPPGSSPTPPPPSNRMQPPATVKKRTSPAKIFLFGAGGLIILAGLIFGGISLFKGIKLSGIASSGSSQYQFKQETLLTLKPGQTSVEDDKGTTLHVDSSAFPDQTSTAQLTSYSAAGDLEKALDESYTIETPFYEVSLQGQQDGSGQASLELPASDPNSKLMMVVDDQYAVVLNVAPKNGNFNTAVHLGPGDLSNSASSEKTQKPGSIFYAVIKPKQNQTSLLKIQASMKQPDADSAPQCSPISVKALSIFNRCQANDDGSVVVLYPSTSTINHFDAYNVAKTIENTINKYKADGFVNATLSPSSPILSVVSSSYSSPEYNFKNGVIYLPPDIPVKLSEEKTAIEHEMGHWVQNRVYSMAIASAVKSRTWWMEVSAEMMVIEIDPDYIAGNMKTYGTITNGTDLVFQDSPYQWPSDFYAQAQLGEVNLCDTGYCPINHDDFVSNINSGRYPFNSSFAQQQLDANLEDFARYLIGVSPQHANTAISLKAVQSQDDYGQQVNVTKTSTKADLKLTYTTNGGKPQIEEESQPKGNILKIAAPLQKDGTYPLQITSNAKYAGLPVILTVDPGVPFLYRADDGDVQSSDGSGEVTIGPISPIMGITNLRIAAYSQAGSQTFSAQLKPIDLEGAWAIKPGNLISNTITCSGGDSESEINGSDLTNFGAGLFGLFTIMGDMDEDPAALEYNWILNSARAPSELGDMKYTFTNKTTIEADKIHMEGELNLPKPEESTSSLPGNPAMVGLSLAFLVPAAGVSLYPFKNKKRKWLLLSLTLLFMVTLLSGCFGFGMYGDIKGDIAVTKLEYTGGEDSASYTVGGDVTGKPIWTIKEGMGTFPVDIFIETSTDDVNGNSTKSIEECKGTATFAITGGIYKDANIIIPANSSSD